MISLQVMGTIGVANVRLEQDELKKYYSSILTIVITSFVVLMSLVWIFMPQLIKYLGLPSQMIILMMFHALGMAFVNFASMRYTYEKKAHLNFAISVLLD